MLINSFEKQGKGVSRLQKPANIYHKNTNLAYTFSVVPDVGNLRETLVFNQLKNAGVAGTLPSQGDLYLPQQKATIEVEVRTRTTNS